MAGQTAVAKNNGKTGEFPLQVYLLHGTTKGQVKCGAPLNLYETNAQKLQRTYAAILLPYPSTEGLFNENLSEITDAGKLGPFRDDSLRPGEQAGGSGTASPSPWPPSEQDESSTVAPWFQGAWSDSSQPSQPFATSELFYFLTKAGRFLKGNVVSSS